MSSQRRSVPRYLTLAALSAALIGCNIAATPYLWRSYAESPNIVDLDAGTAVFTSDGSTFQLLHGSNGRLLRKVNANGDLAWQLELSQNAQKGLILTDNGVAVVDTENTATLVSDSGDTLWSRALAPENSMILKTLQNDQQLIVIHQVSASNSATIEAIDTNTGTTQWTTGIGDDNQRFYSLVSASAKENGETVWLSRVHEGSANPRLQTLRLDANGNTVLLQDTAYSLPLNAISSRYQLNDRHVLEYFDFANNTSLLIGIDDNGDEHWRNSFTGRLSCDEGTGYQFGCLVVGTTDDSLVWINADTGVITHSYTGQFPKATLLGNYPNSARLKSNQNGQWIVMNSHVPADPTSLVQGKTERQFYHQFLVYSGEGKKLKTITMEPGYVTFIYDLLAWWGQSHWRPFTTQTGDLPTYFSANANTLTVVGLEGYYGEAAPGTPTPKFVTAYSLE